MGCASSKQKPEEVKFKQRDNDSTYKPIHKVLTSTQGRGRTGSSFGTEQIIGVEMGLALGLHDRENGCDMSDEI